MITAAVIDITSSKKQNTFIDKLMLQASGVVNEFLQQVTGPRHSPL
jgi:hypothetical protein